MPPDIGEHWEQPFAISRAPSQGSSTASQTTQLVPQSRPGTADPMRSRSNTVASKGARRPRSRGSTASIHSSTTLQTQDQNIADGFPQFMQAQPPQSHHVFGANPEEMIMRFGQQLAHSANNAGLDASLHEAHNSMMPRPEDFQGQSMHAHTLAHHSLPPELAAHGMSGVHMPQYHPMYDGGMENHIPDHIVDENDTSEAGARKKRGSSSTVANDNELRKLLRQYEGYSLKQMAAEVQKHEGAGGKSEKVKQVFAMVWLKENCRKSSGSVRRDRVYCCYAEKCGSERVSVLNPASFGKLVRIIFPNVQTRRLGVRGESKYHYVDLSVIEEKQQQHSTAPNPQGLANVPGTVGGMDGKANELSARPRSISIPQPPADTAVFPSPTTSFTPKFTAAGSSSSGCPCQPPFRSTLESAITLENVSGQTAKMIRQMLQFPDGDSAAVDNESLQLPDVRGYLPANTDVKVGAALAALYRSHCISVIDSFRFCKERNLFRYFSAFHGTLTVPVQKLLTHPNLAPWIKECDWLMYQKMIAFIAPLTTQVVPKPVLDAFSSISQRLTVHIAETFKAQPVHVSLARLVPAHIFCNLLKHMLDVNQSANAAAAWLCHPDNRNQMWLDFASLVDPKEVIARANIPSCAERSLEQILKHDVRALLTPLSEEIVPAQPFYNQPDREEDINAHKFAVQPTVGDGYNFPDKWISFILNIPLAFPNHRAQCIVDKVDALWDVILHRLTLGGAQSFSAWWMTKVFFHEMMLWQVEKGGFMKCTPSSLLNVSLGSERASFNHQQARSSSFSGPVKNESFMSTDMTQNDLRSRTTCSPHANNGTQGDKDLGNTQYDHSNNANIVNDKPGVPDGIAALQAMNNDDSAIDLGDDSMLMTVGKYGDMMASDPADAEGDVVVI
ncbi:transcriptional regulator family: RFX DNA-binding domain [Paecilomyces variotii]|nr:transcriptional regulator family: RFX DNA-binding domain [Paecilomyces variotii]KAJ9332522.1 transcriptional regulator family: RFX DNA-binding domain [Paecilomyces variotii]